MWITILLIALYLILPALIIFSTHASSLLRRIGAVVIAYGVGLLLGNIGLLPKASEAYKNLRAAAGTAAIGGAELEAQLSSGNIEPTDVLLNQVATVQDTLMSVAILLAIPLLLFSLDLKRWMKLAGEALKSLALAMVSLFAAIFLGYFLWGHAIPESWKVGGMLVGIYTGGTPNLAAIATAVEVSPNIFILTHTYDVVIGAICLLFLMSVAQRLFNRFLPRFADQEHHRKFADLETSTSEIDDFSGMLQPKALIALGKALLLSLAIVGVSFGLSLVVHKQAQMTVLILSITSLGLGASLIKGINRIPNTFQMGMYLIIAFSLTVSSMADLRGMFQIEFLNLFLLVAMAVFGSMIIHVLLSKIFRVDTDTTIITITALTYSPPFVPAVAAALKNKDVIISGLTVGIIGYAFGNYAGVLIAYLLKML